MNLYETLAEKKDIIAAKWIDAVLATYHKDGARFFKKQKDRFANPLGHSASVGLGKVVAELASGSEVNASSELEQFIKLRAVQKFTPSEAISFVYDLKKIVIKECGKKVIADNLTQWIGIGDTLDHLALHIFNLYTVDRERLYAVTLQESKSGNAMVARGGCPSGAMMKKHNEEKEEFKVICGT